MHPNPALGVFFHWLGGLASGSFYVPYRGVKHWSWETYWLAGGFFSWIIVPWLAAGVMTEGLVSVLRATPGSTLFWCYVFGVLWGLGGLTFGLTMRYLGMSLGMAMVLGYTAVFGTLVPPIFSGEFFSKVVTTTSGHVILAGIAVCMVGIVVLGLAGVRKERDMPEEQRKLAIAEFDLKKGIAVATFSGVMSACFSYGLAAGAPIKQLTLEHGTTTLWQGLPVLVVVLLGGFTTNFIWCVILHVRNGSAREYYGGVASAPAQAAAGSAGGVAVAAPARVKAPLLNNYLFSAAAGTTWYLQFFFYTMGETQMGAYGFSSWTLHMASIIIFATLWGLYFKEWRGAGAPAKRLLAIGVATLVASTIIIGWGNYIAVNG